MSSYSPGPYKKVLSEFLLWWREVVRTGSLALEDNYAVIIVPPSHYPCQYEFILGIVLRMLVKYELLSWQSEVRLRVSDVR